MKTQVKLPAEEVNLSICIALPCYGIVLDLAKDMSVGKIISDLHKGDAPRSNPCFDVAMDALESIILAHAIAGVDIERPDYLEGIETAVEACANQLVMGC